MRLSHYNLAHDSSRKSFGELFYLRFDFEGLSGEHNFAPFDSLHVFGSRRSVEERIRIPCEKKKY